MKKEQVEPDDVLLLKVPEAARRLSLSPATVYRLIERGEIPTVRIWRSVRIPVDGLRKWIEERTTKP
jgi:excisionase family DNA binding protein